jgi:hypothetical protein
MRRLITASIVVSLALVSVGCPRDTQPDALPKAEPTVQVDDTATATSSPDPDLQRANELIEALWAKGKFTGTTDSFVFDPSDR